MTKRSGECIRHISRKSLRANRRRNLILIAAIALTTVMLTALFSIGGSMKGSIEDATMYQVGTSAHAGFKFLTQEQYNRVLSDLEVKEASFNIFVGFAVNEELAEDYTELRYTEENAAKWSFCYPQAGHLPEKENEAAMPTQVLDAYGLPHELGQTIAIEISDGETTYRDTFTVCGFWEKPSATMANEIFVSKPYQEKHAPVWQTQEDYDAHMAVNSISGSVNPSLWFGSAVNIDGQMDALKDRCGFGAEVNEGVNWAYAASNLDFTAVALAVFVLLVILVSGYLLIYNIFYISVSEDIHFYGLLKTIGTGRKQLNQIVHRQALLLSAIGIPIGLSLGYLLSIVLLPLLADSFSNIPCRIHTSLWVFVLSGLFAFGTVWVSCVKPCRFIRRISAVEAIRYTENGRGRKKTKKSRIVTPVTMAWENLFRTPGKTIAVVLSLTCSVMLLNTTVSMVQGFDEDKYISSFAVTDFCVTDRTITNNTSLEVNLESLAPEDLTYFKCTPGLTDLGIVYMSEGMQCFEGDKLERLKQIFTHHADSFPDEAETEYFRSMIYDRHCLNSHIYGVNEFAASLIESADGAGDGVADWSKFKTGAYVIVTAFGSNGEDPYYEPGERIPVNLPDGTVKQYTVLAVGDLPYAMTVQHGHGVDISILLPESEYLAHCPDCRGAMKLGLNVEEASLAAAEDYVADYCETGHGVLDYQSKGTYADSFDAMVRTYLLVGGALSFLLGLIAILNFINLTLTSLNSRRQELGILHAVGMTGRQLRRMLVWEGLFKVVLTAVLTLTVGQLILYGILTLLTGEMWMFTYTFVLWPLLAGLLVFAVLAWLIPACIYSCTSQRFLTVNAGREAK